MRRELLPQKVVLTYRYTIVLTILIVVVSHLVSCGPQAPNINPELHPTQYKGLPSTEVRRNIFLKKASEKVFLSGRAQEVLKIIHSLPPGIQNMEMAFTLKGYAWRQVQEYLGMPLDQLYQKTRAILPSDLTGTLIYAPGCEANLIAAMYLYQEQGPFDDSQKALVQVMINDSIAPGKIPMEYRPEVTFLLDAPHKHMPRGNPDTLFQTLRYRSEASAKAQPAHSQENRVPAWE
jgi:hypothetical protein